MFFKFHKNFLYCMQHNYIYKGIEEWLSNYGYWTCHYSNEKIMFKIEWRRHIWGNTFSVFVCFDRALARIPEKEIMHLSAVHSFHRLPFQRHLTLHTTRQLQKRYSRCLMAWRATGSRQMFWSAEMNPFLTSNNYEMKETVENALEGIYLSKDRRKNTYSL